MQKQLRRLGIAEDGAKRLVQFVRERRGQFAHRGDAGNVSQFVALLLDLLFCLLALGDVERHARHPLRLTRRRQEHLGQNLEPSMLPSGSHNPVVITEIRSFLEALP